MARDILSYNKAMGRKKETRPAKRKRVLGVLKKIGGKATALETAQHGNGARVKGDLEFIGNLVGHSNSLSTNNIISENLTIVSDGHVEFDGCAVGFDLETPTYNASDTDVDFTDGNKQFVTFGAGNITDLNLIFPDTSGNFVLLLKQDGTGSRTVTNYKAMEFDESSADGSAAVITFDFA